MNAPTPKNVLKAAGKTLSEQDDKIHVAEVVHHGEQLILPTGMDVSAAIELLERRREYLEEEVIIQESFKVFPWDGANALALALTKRFGWAAATTTPGFFGSNPPKMISIDVGPNEKIKVPWGRFSLPNVDGYIQTEATMIDGMLCFAVGANVQRKDENTLNGLFQDLREILKKHSIYRGKAFKMRFREENGSKLEMPTPQFIETNDVDPANLIYAEAVQTAIETNLFTPIQRIADCKANGIPAKRGVLLGGTYGTGKTMAAKVASLYAAQAGVTFLYVARADELADAVKFAMQYSDPGCVIFCEDIDRAMDGERTDEMDDILNIIDGIDSKSSNIIVVLTTNNLEGIHPAMLRPGRLDAVIDVTPPDAKAVEKLLRVYGGSAIAPEIDLTSVSTKLAGRIPAVIYEVVKRAKLAQLRRQAPGTLVTTVDAEALQEAADTMEAQLKLLYRDATPAKPTIDGLLREMVEHAVADIAETTDDTHGGVIKLIEMHR